MVPQANATATGDIDCSNTAIEILGSTNVMPASYLWTGPGITESTMNIQTNQTGIYNFTVTGVSGCSTTTTIEVFENMTLPDITAYALDVDCVTGGVSLEGFTDVPNPSYHWEGPGVSEDFNLAYTNQPGVYTFSVLDMDNSCSATTEVTLIAADFVIPAYVNILEPDEITCTNLQATLSGTSDAIDPSYLWTGPGGFSNSEQSTATTIAGTYTLIVTASNGCSISTSVEVVENTAAPDVLISSTENLDCNHPEIALVGSTSIANPQYEWQNPNGNISNDTLLINSGGVYFLEITNIDNNCTTIEEIEIVADLAVPTSDAGADGLLDCTSTSYDLDGSNSSGDSLIYTWYNSLDEEIGNRGTVLSVNLSGTYTLLITNQSNGCTSTDEVEVSQDASVPTSNAGADGLLDCTNTTYNLDGNSSSGDSLIYTWYNSLDEEIGTGAVLSVSLSGTYTLLITNQSNGCTSTDEVEVTQDASVPTSNAGADGLLDCTNTTYNLDGSGSSGDSLIYTWYNSLNEEIGTGVVLSVSLSGTYTLLVTNQSNGCTSTDEVEVTQDASVPTSNAGVDGLLDCTSTSYDLDGNGSSGDNLILHLVQFPG